MNVPNVSPSLLRKGLVVTVENWHVAAPKKVLVLPSIGYEVRFSTADVREMPDPQFAAFATAFDKRFTDEFNFVRRKWFADIRYIVRLAEDEIRNLGITAPDKAQAVAQMREIVDRTNGLLRAKCDEWAEGLQQLGQAGYDSALSASYRAVKRRPVKSTVKVAAEFVLSSPMPPAVPISPVSRFVTMPTTRRA